MTLESTLLELLTASLVRPLLLVAAAGLLLRFLQVSHPASKHAVWSAVLVGVVVLPFAALLAPHIELAVLPESSLFSLSGSEALNEDRPSVNHAKQSERPAATGPRDEGFVTASANLAASAMDGVGGSQFWRLAPLRTFVVWVYLAGLIVAFGYRGLGWYLLWRVRVRSLSHGFTWLRESRDVLVPITVGIVRPTVLLPTGWRQWPAHARRAILTHEFAHIRRRDAWIQAISRLARCLFWFHPLVWLVSRKVSELAEMACDAAVVQRGVDPFRYSRLLVEFSDVVRRNGYRSALPGLAITGHSWLTRRIDHIIAMSSVPPRRLAKPVTTLLLLGTPLMAAAATFQFSERGGLRILTEEVEVRASAAVSSTLQSIIQVAAKFNPVPMISQTLPQNGLPAQAAPFSSEAFLNTHCVNCHSTTARMGSFTLSNLDLTNLRTNADVWEKVILKLRSGVHMDVLEQSPGNARPQPSEVRNMVQWLEDGLDRLPPVYQGSPTSRPLNRTEYGKAIRELLGLQVDIALLLPPDEGAYFFDNIASVLEAQRKRIPPETWTSAAEKITELAMASPASRSQILSCRPLVPAEEDNCATAIFTSLAAAAYRGKETPEDIVRLVEAYRTARNRSRYMLEFQTGIKAALVSLLSNRKFLYRDELEPANLSAGQSYAVSDLDLAARLSFFLWSSGPDSRLVELAKQGRLKDPAILESEVRRMLQDPRSGALAVNFAEQWLGLRRLQTIDPLPVFREFDEALRAGMKREVELFFDSVVHEDRSVLDLLNGDYTFVNDRLARHYGIPNVMGDQFRRVVLGPEFDNHRGLLGKAAVLTATSMPTRTSIVTRGKWVLDSILGVGPPDPPPNVPPMPEKIAGRTSDPTLRDLMAQHNSVDRCRNCHRLFDPIGIVLENFDAIGKWRTTDEGKPIDTSVEFLDGTRINGPADLRRVLNARSELFVRTLTQKLLTYGLGRGATYQDMPAVRALTREAAAENYRFSSIVLGIVKNPVFQMNVKRGN